MYFSTTNDSYYSYYYYAFLILTYDLLLLVRKENQLLQVVSIKGQEGDMWIWGKIVYTHLNCLSACGEFNLSSFSSYLSLI